MLQIAALSDIHGNFGALLAVWRDLERHNLSTGPVLNAGDNVCYGENPEETVQFLRSRNNIFSVQGNYDKTVALFPGRANSYKKKWGQFRPEKFQAIKQDSDKISDETRTWLLELPREQTMRYNGHSVIVTHYSPGAKEGIGPWTSSDDLERIASKTTAEVVVCGHTHFPFVRKAGNVLFVNPGTVGRSAYDVSTYAVLTLESNSSPSARITTVIEP